MSSPSDPPVAGASARPGLAPGATSAQAPSREIGRYVLHEEIAAGGMARVFLGRLIGPIRFSRTVAIKCLHPLYARDPEFVAMLMDEAHLASRVRHPNVVATLDVVSDGGELFLVMEYVHGDSLARLLREARERGERVPISVAVGIVTGVLFGLHAAHEARGEGGEPLDIVHRDVSPQNVIVGVDGVSRVLDFGIAKAVSRVQHTADGQVKGKLRYMAPEQLRTQPVDRRVDVFAASALLWEVLVGERLFDGPDAGAIVTTILMGEVRRPGALVSGIPPALDAIVMRGLDKNREGRFATAREMAVALEHTIAPATARQIGEWVDRVGGETLRARSERLASLENAPTSVPAPSSRAEEPTAPMSVPASSAATAAAAASGRVGEETDVSASRTAPAIDLGPALASAEARAPTRPRGRGLLLAALGLAMAGALALALRTMLPSAPDVDATAAAGAQTASNAPGGAAAATPTADEQAAPGTASAAAPSSAPAASSSAAPVSAPARRGRAGCDPPYTIENGIKRFKKQCL